MTDLSAMGDSWEELVSTGIVLAEHMDTNRWALGDIGCKVETRYGENSMGQFSKEIGIENEKTFRDYTRVARRFELSTRNAFSGSTLTFSHFRSAMRAKDDAEVWLARAADEAWTAKQLQREIAAAIGKPTGPVKVWEGVALIDMPHYLDARPLAYMLYAPDGIPVEYTVGNVTKQLKPGQRVIVKVYEVTDNA